MELGKAQGFLKVAALTSFLEKITVCSSITIKPFSDFVCNLKNSASVGLARHRSLI